LLLGSFGLLTMKKRRNWPLILFGVVVLVVFVGIGAIIAVTAWVQQNFSVRGTSQGDAQTEFETVRQKFQHRPPLLEMRNGRPAYTNGTPPAPMPTRVALDRMYVMAWDPDEEKLVSVSVPFWLLRLKATPIEFSSYAAGFDDNHVNLRPEDLERYGPGIILDATMPSGERVLLWAQ
jgi:hypothetical protein